ncbi:MAG: Hsp20/alpha crystallin family protein [Candidatus Schekmanbacteria bacterium]|nr:Hsp20/alpha crystallin family protein [Candidatus Schekmanbacteria bacterium]
MQKKQSSGGLEGILKGLTGLTEALGDLAEKGGKLSQTKEFQVKGKNNEPLKGVYGFSVKMGLGNEEIKVEPFGNIRKTKSGGKSIVHEIREPMVDVLEEEDGVLVVAEMPGVEAGDIKVDLKDDILSIHGERGDKKYSKELLLPGSFKKSQMTVSAKNGIVEIKCRK